MDTLGTETAHPLDERFANGWYRKNLTPEPKLDEASPRRGRSSLLPRSAHTNTASNSTWRVQIHIYSLIIQIYFYGHRSWHTAKVFAQKILTLVHQLIKCVVTAMCFECPTAWLSYRICIHVRILVLYTRYSIEDRATRKSFAFGIQISNPL